MKLHSWVTTLSQQGTEVQDRRSSTLGVHISERNAVVTFQELDAAGREKMALRKPELSERYAEVDEAIVT